ncbi:MAG TPA: M14 metallopeptidase family protein [Acidobacteriota bacterium]|jgi:hypothetical protein
MSRSRCLNIFGETARWPSQGKSIADQPRSHPETSSGTSLQNIKRFSFAALTILLFTFNALAQQVTTPESFLGFKVGADRKLAPWPKIVEYFRLLDRQSDRVLVQELGKSTEGRPFIVAFLSEPENLKRLDYFQRLNQRLADPRVTSEQDALRLINGDSKVIAMITCNIHSTEVASAQTSMEFAYNMATQSDTETRLILHNAITLLVPSLNPDGQEMVVNWYNKTLGTPYEGTSPPFLYHRYLGHDNNRDWYMFTQVETQLAVSKLHNAWHPQVVYDVHQMSSTGARIFVPPWLDPVDPNIDPILQQETIFVGSSMATDLTSAGKTGVVMNAIYDLWTPSRHYQNYHGGFRILTESASARIATPVRLNFDELSVQGRGYSPKQRSWNFPEPWRGGDWRLRDIVDYQLIAFKSLLHTMANNRQRFLANFYRIGKKAVLRSEGPFAFVVSPQQKDPESMARMLNTLRFGMVEIYQASAPFSAGGVRYPAGSYIIPYSQPYGSWAKTLLERQDYPDLREYPGGPPRRPYDVTAQTLPFLMGVKTAAVRERFDFAGKLVEKIAAPSGRVERIGNAAGYILKRSAVNDAPALLRLMKQGFQVSFVTKAQGEIPYGAAFISGDRRIAQAVELPARELGVIFTALPPAPLSTVKAVVPRIALYKSYMPSMDEGWTRWIFDQYQIPYETILDRDFRQGNLRRRFDAVILPDVDPEGGRDVVSVVVEGHRSGSMPEEYTGGITPAGLLHLREFVESGGTLVTFNRAAEVPLTWNIGVSNVTRGLSNRELYGPGSILNAIVKLEHPVTAGMDNKSYIWFEESPAFDFIPSPNIQPLLQYPSSGLLASGWLLGSDKLANRYAAVEVKLGKGRVVLFGFRPQYRAQSLGTYPLVFNSLLYSATKD